MVIALGTNSFCCFRALFAITLLCHVSMLLRLWSTEDWRCERLVLVVNAFSLSVPCMVGPHLGWSVDEDAVAKYRGTSSLMH